MSSELKHQQNCLQSLWRKSKKHHSVSNQEKLSNFELAMETITWNQILLWNQSYLQVFRWQYLEYLQLINNIRGNHIIPETLFQDSKALTSDLDKSNMFNQFFCSVFTRSNFQLPTTNTLSAKGPTLSCITILEEGVYLTHCSLESSKATWPDGIGPNILKSCALALYLPLHHIFAQS